MPRPTFPALAADLRTSQARALGDPTRAQILGYLCDAAEPSGVSAMAAHFGLHHNAVRQHLAKLRDAGLVVEESSPPSGPGRPALRYRPAPGAADRWGGPSPYESLAMLLLELLGGGTPFDVGVAGGRRIAAELGYDGTAPGAAAGVEQVARRLGFEPRRETRRDRLDLVLERCPFVTAASAAPDVVCELHRGLSVGVASVAAGRDVDVGLTVRRPERAGCRLHLDAD
jgi:predicted ArsR family transcriptional regulator